MIGWILLTVYAIGYLAFWRTVVFFIATDVAYSNKIDGEALAFGVIIGSLGTAAWPLIGACLAVQKLYTARGDDIASFITPRSRRRELALVERERRIASLERELGIKP